MIAVQKVEAAAAQVLGNIAFKAGKKAVPCHDAALMKMIEGRAVGTSLHILTGWETGWHQANLYGQQ